MELDVDAMASNIQFKLLDKGIIVKFDDIKLILDLEMEYLVENGFAEVE